MIDEERPEQIFSLVSEDMVRHAEDWIRAAPEQTGLVLDSILPVTTPDEPAADAVQCNETLAVASYIYGFTAVGLHPLSFLLPEPNALSDDEKNEDTPYRKRLRFLRNLFKNQPTRLARFLYRRTIRKKNDIPVCRLLRVYDGHWRTLPITTPNYEPDQRAVDRRQFIETCNSVRTNPEPVHSERHDPIQAIRTCCLWIRHLDGNLDAYRGLSTNQQLNFSLLSTHGNVPPTSVSPEPETEAEDYILRCVLLGRERGFCELAVTNLLFASFVYDPTAIVSVAYGTN